MHSERMYSGCIGLFFFFLTGFGFLSAQEGPVLSGRIHVTEFRGISPWPELKKTSRNERKFQAGWPESRHVTDVLVFWGPWCSDSKVWVPVFLGLDSVETFRNVEFVALDRSKRDSEGLAEKYKISHVPTFIFLQEGTETGRITETPASGILSQEVLEILLRKK